MTRIAFTEKALSFLIHRVSKKGFLIIFLLIFGQKNKKLYLGIKLIFESKFGFTNKMYSFNFCDTLKIKVIIHMIYYIYLQSDDIIQKA